MKQLILLAVFAIASNSTNAQTKDKVKLTLPNVITPNNDGKNDRLIIGDFTIENAPSLVVVNRSGKIIYESSHYINNWDASTVESGQYYYSVRLQSGKTKSGFLSVLN